MPNETPQLADVDLSNAFSNNGQLGSQEALLLLDYYKSHDWKGFNSEMILIDSDSPLTSYLLLSEYLLFKKEYQEALEYLVNAEKLGFKGAELYILKAKLYTKVKVNDSAIDEINRAILINRFDAGLYLEKGLLYLGFGDTLSGINYIEKSFELDSARVDVVIMLATLKSKMGKMSEANQWLLKGLEKNPENKELKYVQVSIYRAQHLDTESNKVLSSLLRDGDVNAGFMLIDWFEEVGKTDSLLFYSNLILEIDSVNVDALLIKGAAFETKGYFSSSKKYYEEVLGIDSLNEEAIQGVQKVNGKIAYLRKLKEQKESLPTFDFLAPNNKKTLNE